jgi:hypothetical protein|tara:strand:- start:868 stop:1029 length:162 start_codon:yes stop_codon:yes gene_type:complete
MKRLSENIKNIEKSVEAYQEGKETYDVTFDKLLSFGYSFKEAVEILRNAKELP